MGIIYAIEVYDPKTRKYRLAWKGDSWKMANTMFDKPYYARHTRRILSITTEVVFQEKGKDHGKLKR